MTAPRGPSVSGQAQGGTVTTGPLPDDVSDAVDKTALKLSRQAAALSHRPHTRCPRRRLVRLTRTRLTP